MRVKLLTEHYLELISLKVCCTGLSESTLSNATLLEITCHGSNGRAYEILRLIAIEQKWPMNPHADVSSGVRGKIPRDPPGSSVNGVGHPDIFVNVYFTEHRTNLLRGAVRPLFSRESVSVFLRKPVATSDFPMP